MKTIRYSQDALRSLRKPRSEAAAIMSKLARYAATGAGDVKPLLGADGVERLRVEDCRVVFLESSEAIVVTAIGPRGSVYR